MTGLLRWKGKVWAAGAVGVALLVLGVGMPIQASASSTPFRVYAIEALSGPTASQGKAELQGLQAAVAVMNKAGGVDGHHIVFSYADDAGDPTTAINLVTGQVDSGTPPNMVVGGTDGS